MKLEEQARQNIDQLLTKAGWIIQDVKNINLKVGRGIAVREYYTGAGPADYLLIVDRNVVTAIEAKPVWSESRQ